MFISGGGTHPIDWVSTSPCFHIKNNATGICYAENLYVWHKHTTIGNDVWIGARATILPGVSIADGAVIGAGSIVTKNVGPYEIWAGNPARLIRKRFDEETIEKLLGIRWWDWDDKKLSRFGMLFPDYTAFIRAEKG